LIAISAANLTFQNRELCDRGWLSGLQRFGDIQVIEFVKFTPVAGSIFGPLSQTHFSKSEFKNEISSSALLDIQMTLLCVCGVDSFIPELEHWIEKTFSRSLFQKEAFGIRFMDSDSWNEAEVNFLRQGKLFRRDYLDYLKNEARFENLAVLELTFRKVSLGKLSEIDPATGVRPWSSYIQMT